MDILVDENIPLVTVGELRAAGHDVLDFRQTARQGIPDADLWKECQAQKRLLITTDKGFSEHAREPHWGIMIIRLRRPNQARIHERVLWAMKVYGAAEWPGLLLVVRDRVKSVRRSSRPKN